MERIYYPINEKMAKLAHDMMSMSDYAEGGKTRVYKANVDAVYDLAERVIIARPKYADKAVRIANSYAKRLAENFNANSRIGTMCPSILIAGGSGFNVRKKEKQNAALDKNMAEFNEIQELMQKLEAILGGKEVIQSDDEDAIIQLEDKLSTLEADQVRMKEINAYYRKHKTLDGCPELTDVQIQKLKASMAMSWRSKPMPYESFMLTNNNANIHRIRERLSSLKAEKEKETTEVEYSAIGLTVKEDTEAMRLQFFFNGKPEADIRTMLKSHGFKWSPSNGCWQRLLNNNARYDANRIIKELTKE